MDEYFGHIDEPRLPQILLLIFDPFFFFFYQDKFVDDVSVLIGQRDDMCLLCSQN